MASCPHRCTIFTTENNNEPGSSYNTKDNEISMNQDIHFIINKYNTFLDCPLARYRDIQKISTHMAEVSSKSIKDITNILYHNCVTYHENQMKSV